MQFRQILVRNIRIIKRRDVKINTSLSYSDIKVIKKIITELGDWSA